MEIREFTRQAEQKFRENIDLFTGEEDPTQNIILNQGECSYTFPGQVDLQIFRYPSSGVAFLYDNEFEDWHAAGEVALPVLRLADRDMKIDGFFPLAIGYTRGRYRIYYMTEEDMILDFAVPVLGQPAALSAHFEEHKKFGGVISPDAKAFHIHVTPKGARYIPYATCKEEELRPYTRATFDGYDKLIAKMAMMQKEGLPSSMYIERTCDCFDEEENEGSSWKVTQVVGGKAKQKAKTCKPWWETVFLLEDIDPRSTTTFEQLDGHIDEAYDLLCGQNDKSPVRIKMPKVTQVDVPAQETLEITSVDTPLIGLTDLEDILQARSFKRTGL